MLKTSLIILLTLAVPLTSYSMPKSFEVWFLSVNKTAELEPLLKDKRTNYKMVAQALQCQPMGDYCFDPQVGLYKVGEKNNVREEVFYEELDKTQKYNDLESASSLDRQLINCDKDNLFDLFCGKRVAQTKKDYRVELWIDISGTMKQVDFVSHDKTCYRESFVRSLDNQCPFNEKMKISLFNESKKESGNMSDVCLNYGLNEIDRLMDQIQKSDASHLIIITDIYEAHDRFVQFIEQSGKGTIKGLKEPFYAKDMADQVSKLAKKCQ